MKGFCYYLHKIFTVNFYYGKILNSKIKFLLPDKLYLQMQFRIRMQEKLDLKNPKTFNQKLQWLKLYDRRPIMTIMVDKYEAKQYVANIIGEQYIIQTIGVWDSFEEIDFNLLPERFVMKCTHDSGKVVVCRNKSDFNCEDAKRIINSSLKNNYYFEGREWPYKNVKPRIIVEQYMEDKNGCLNDYKFTCFDGEVDDVMICVDREKGETKFYFYDKKWRLLKLNQRGMSLTSNPGIKKPENLDKMFEIASILSKGFKYLRVDLYNVDGKIYFGELTFFPCNGLDKGLLPQTDLYFGSKISLK